VLGFVKMNVILTSRWFVLYWTFCMLNCRLPLCTSVTILFFLLYVFNLFTEHSKILPKFCIYVHATYNINLTRTEYIFKFNVCKSMHHHTIQINKPTRCINLSSLLLDVYVQLNMFWASSLLSSGATTTAVAASGLTFGAWW